MRTQSLLTIHQLTPSFSPRDAITISRSFSDTATFIDISTSLPRSSDEPAYLRPSPPFVRSHVKRELPRLFFRPRILVNCLYSIRVVYTIHTTSTVAAFSRP